MWLRALSLHQERTGQESALTLLSLSVKKIGIDYAYAGLALLDLCQGSEAATLVCASSIWTQLGIAPRPLTLFHF